MPLTPIDEIHALQIQAGTLGRKTGHAFEDAICAAINAFAYPFVPQGLFGKHLLHGDPARLLLEYLIRHYAKLGLKAAVALSTGALATSEDGKKWLSINGSDVRRCKSDIVVTLTFSDGEVLTVGISTKQCNNRLPTNAQLYFTTARGFANLLRKNDVPVSEGAEDVLRRFCGDAGFRPLDHGVVDRLVDPRRYFWEELPPVFRDEWEKTLGQYQDHITRLLLQKAYLDDPFIPEFLIHKTKISPCWTETEVALYSIDELVALSCAYQGFATRPYSVRKGSFRDPLNVTHLAPRFGVVQMQRGGQAQHPDQLQFNLEASYFYKLDKI